MNTISIKERKNIWKNPIFIAVAATVLLVAAVLITVLVIDGMQDDSILSGVPDNSLDAAMKLQSAGYSVEMEKELLLPALTQQMAEHYGITFTGSITAYLKALDPESMEMKAEIFYFANEAEAKQIYEVMKKNWKFDKEQGELRHRGNVVYMGFSEVLNAFEK
ncbi:MAG: hypothetical protein E7599_03685 [Ruminococcaceae bacterium]|nr:hypothetical protein [Oscillospiraceae bacterium]